MTWYLNWFGKDYLELYSHRNDEEAAAQVSFILDTIGRDSSSLNVLDIACGRGRHLLQFARQKSAVSGIDMSADALEICQSIFAKEGLPLNVSQADMRSLPFEDLSFDLITSLFTSFGYFETDNEHLELLREWKRCLKLDGTFVIDYMNREQVIASLVPKSEESQGETTITQERQISADGKRVNKQITITDLGSKHVKQFQESVRLYSPEELYELLSQAGFEIIQQFGDFTGSDFALDSPRLIVFASRT